MWYKLLCIPLFNIAVMYEMIFTYSLFHLLHLSFFSSPHLSSSFFPLPLPTPSLFLPSLSSFRHSLPSPLSFSSFCHSLSPLTTTWMDICVTLCEPERYRWRIQRTQETQKFEKFQLYVPSLRLYRFANDIGGGYREHMRHKNLKKFSYMCHPCACAGLQTIQVDNFENTGDTKI